MKSTRYLTLCYLVGCSCIASADLLTFKPELDADNQTNTSGTDPYSSSVTRSNAPVGIRNAGDPNRYQDTFFFADGDTDIKFSFDVEWNSSGGSLNPTTQVLGVGDNSLIENIAASIGSSPVSESVRISVSNLSVDLSSYDPGSFNGIVLPQLDSFNVYFDRVSFGSFDDVVTDSDGVITGGTIVDVTGSGAIQYSSTSENFDLGTDGLTETETELTFGLNLNSFDAFSISATRFNVLLNISEGSPAAVPEPSSALALLIGGVGIGVRRYRRRSK